MEHTDIIEALKWRYTTKSFDPSKKISKENEEKIKELLQWSPSSINSQPWHFVLTSSEEGKKRLAKGTAGFFSFNESKVTQASHVVLFCTKTEISDQYLSEVTDKEDEDGRFANEDLKEQNLGAKKLFTNIHRYDLKDAQHWMEKQVYLNIGNFLLGVAALGIDAVPMEGIDMKALDEELGLREKGFSSIVMVGLGYRSEDDFNAKLPKSRLNQDDIITVI
ncbi:oxygen-insensitivone NAD(P)H nitroreductase [Nonlabens tegetincola]|uniref:Oxygen-insensitivone NAD(P)H nitroreductase n=1 Tax=Nonlabens tegetincola TaxID=323273 RepID=A0A090Q498_9FLAO|nr:MULTISPECIES: oxygen-insensitive NAD(P)H-dependent nitroreductase NfsB [Nonlabens]GAK96563.1 oxygen-insensitivone NAD(P)H nitroreductase [Nonlabens tegetincola]